MHGCSRLFPFDNGAAPNIPIQAVMGMNEELAAKGYIQKADTLEELAGKLGLPADALIATVERNNENYDIRSTPISGKSRSVSHPCETRRSTASATPACCCAPWTGSTSTPKARRCAQTEA